MPSQNNVYRKQTDWGSIIKKGNAMTIWWICLSLIVTAFASVVTTQDLYQHPNGQGIINLLRGTCATSALCVGIGYYGFAISFSYVQKPNLIRQLHWKFRNRIPYWIYFIVDTTIHVGTTSRQFYLWNKHITLRSVTMTFVFHRLWSLYHSRGLTLYYKGDDVYAFRKCMPLWSWRLMYVVEGTNCALCAIWCIGTGRL